LVRRVGVGVGRGIGWALVRAVLITPDSGLELVEVEVPRPGSREVVIEVGAASVNRADLAHREGRHDPGLTPAEGPTIAGMDAAGVVVEAGERAACVKVGDRVMGLVSGGYAERAIVDSRLAIPVPERWTLVEAAAAVSGLLTAYDALVNAAHVRAGESVVVLGASSPVGLTTVQLAKHLGARPVIGTARSHRREDLVLAAGAERVLVTAGARFADQVLDATGGRGADVVIDHVGGPYLADSIRSLAIEGRLISVGRLGGNTGPLDLELLAYKRARIIGVTFRTRSLEQSAEIARGVTHDLLPAMQAGALRPIIDRTYPLEQAAEAQARMAANHHHGKIVLTTASAASRPRAVDQTMRRPPPARS
jgi:NADPH2:quinone reductase